jgi:hypothetical protein
MPTTQSLSERDQKILDFEQSWWKYAGAKEAEVRERFGVTLTRYYQVLNSLIDDPAAAAYAPLVVGRLRRLRTARANQRRARRQGFALTGD